MSAHSQTFTELNPTPVTSGWQKLAQGNGLIRTTVAAVALGLGGGLAIQSHRESNNNQLAISEYLHSHQVAPGQTRTIPNIYNNAHVTFEALNMRGKCPAFVVEGESKVRVQKGCKLD